MTTDNRTNEPTPEQVEAAAKAMHGTGNPWFAAYGDWGAAGFEIKKAFRESARAALEAATPERDAAVAAIEVTRKLHHKITRYGNDYYSISAESYEDDPSSYDDLEPFDLCAECYEVERLICEECGGDAPIGHRSSWPCPTVAALDGAPEPEREREYRRVRPDGVPVFNAVFETMPLLDDYYTAEYRTVSPWLPVKGESKP